MSEKSSNPNHAKNRTDTMIGAGVRVEGKMTFTGVLRIQGEILGDVSCNVDSNGTIVVDGTGNLTGSVAAPHIVVRGQINGPLHSSQSIQIQQGGCIAGDAFYKEIDIHAGGILDGALTPTATMDRPSSRMEPGIQAAKATAIGNPGISSGTGDGFAARLGGAHMVGGIAALALVAIAAVWMSRNPTILAPPAMETARPADAASKALAATPPHTAASGGAPNVVAAVVDKAVPPPASPGSEVKELSRAPASDSVDADPAKPVTVQGVNPGKPAGVFLLISKEPSVLMRKKRQDTSEGTRIEVAQGETVSITITRNELFRVLKGRDMEIFYQGRKVAPKTIESGAWMSFVPQSSGAAEDKR